MSARRLLWVLLLVQAAGAGAIALAAAAWLGAAPWLAVLAGVASVLLVRLAINANNFAMSARFASPTPAAFALGPVGRLRLFAEEFAASMLHSSWYMARAAARARIYPDSTAPPVLLLHGYGCNSGYWAHLAPLLDAARISHAAVDLEPLAGDIDGYVPLVEQAVITLCAAAGAGQVVIVAHSMGGLVARAWMRRFGTARVARIVTLGTPHHGTSLANFALGANAAQMRRGRGAAAAESDWLRDLAASEDAGRRALITSIYTHHDNIVTPQTSSALPGARNIEFGGVGHVALGGNPRILAAVMREIAQLPRQPPEPPTLLLVDDDRFMLDVLADFLGAEGYRILSAQSGAEGLELLARHKVQVILCDQCMPGMSGTDFAAQVRERYPDTWRIILSAQSEAGAIADALAAGVVDRYHTKPWSGPGLRDSIREAFRLQRERARV